MYCLFTPHLDKLFNLWNNTICQTNYWVHTAGRDRSPSILERVHKAFFNYYQFHAMNYMPDETILARMMTALDFEFKRSLYYHDEGYKSDNDYGLPSQITRPIFVYSVFTTEASFDLDDFTTAQCPISPLTPRCPRSLPFQEGVCQHLTFDKMSPLTPETAHQDDKEPLPTVDLDDPGQDEEPVPDSREYLYIHVIPRPATQTSPPQPIPVTPSLQPNKGVPATPPQQPDQVKVPQEFELMEPDIPENIPYLLDVPQEVMSYFDAWDHDVLSYQF